MYPFGTQALEAPGRLEPARSNSDWGKGPPTPDVDRFLRGPQLRRFELGQAVQIFVEMLRGFRELHFVGPCVTVFGSARFTEDQPYYRLAREVGMELAHTDFNGQLVLEVESAPESFQVWIDGQELGTDKKEARKRESAPINSSCLPRLRQAGSGGGSKTRTSWPYM